MVGEHKRNITANFEQDRLKIVGGEGFQSLYQKIALKISKIGESPKKSTYRVGGHLDNIPVNFGQNRPKTVGVDTF